MNWLVTDLESAYSSLKTSLGGASLYLLATFIGICILIYQFYNEFKTAKANRKGGHIDIKAFFNLFGLYVTCFIVIVFLPFIISGIESVLGEFQNKIINNNSNTLNISIGEAHAYFEKEYVEKETADRGVVGSVWGFGMDKIKEGFYILCLYGAKHTFTMFAASRYMYLMMLELIAPVAIVFALSEKTLPFFFTFVKHFIICYLMLPFFVLTNMFADKVIDAVFTGGYLEWNDFNKLGMMGVLMAFILKAYLFKQVNDKIFRLI
ncbi:MAG: hypothetical protein LBV47_01230 [Bacteroidales bacterium]|jgi:hypothetical protein|nr:hypothetical protein [Bacteroidales bacterium]